MIGVAFISQVVETMWKNGQKQRKKERKLLSQKLATLSAVIEILNDPPAASLSPSSLHITHVNFIQIT